jgi:exonuclease VII small subunit
MTLIAAAPEMFEALRRIVDTLEMAQERLETAGFMSAARDCNETIEIARAALTKATSIGGE